jgi:hypothetical protein
MRQTRARIRRVLFLAAMAGTLVSGCESPTGPGSVWGTWQLVSLDGRALPQPLNWYPSVGSATLLSESIEFVPVSRRYRRIRVTRVCGANIPSGCATNESISQGAFSATPPLILVHYGVAAVDTLTLDDSRGYTALHGRSSGGVAVFRR